MTSKFMREEDSNETNTEASENPEGENPEGENTVSKKIEGKLDKSMREKIAKELFEAYEKHQMERLPQHWFLTDNAKEMLYRAHIENPEFWTIDKLASHVQIPASRVAAIIRLKHLAKDLEQKKGKLDNTRLVIFENVVKDRLLSEAPFKMLKKKEEEEERRGKPKIEFVEAEFLENEYLYWRKFRKVQLSNDLPKNPPPDVDPNPVILEQPTKSKEEVEELRKKDNIPEGGGKIFIINTSKQKSHVDREILVRELDGTGRTASWEERVEILNQRRRKDFRKLVQEELQDAYQQQKTNESPESRLPSWLQKKSE